MSLCLSKQASITLTGFIIMFMVNVSTKYANDTSHDPNSNIVQNLLFLSTNYNLQFSNGCINSLNSWACDHYEFILDHKDVTNGYFSQTLTITELESEINPSLVRLFNDSTLRNKCRKHHQQNNFRLTHNDLNTTESILSLSIIDHTISGINFTYHFWDTAKYYGLILSTSSWPTPYSDSQIAILNDQYHHPVRYYSLSNRVIPYNIRQVARSSSVYILISGLFQ